MEQLTTVKKFEDASQNRLSKQALDYYRSGANAMVSLKDAEEAFDKYKLKTRAQIDQDKFEGLQTEILGEKVPSPIWIASTAFHKMAHPEGEVATAKAANTSSTPVMMSNWATTPLEVFASSCPDSLKMFQIYMSKVPEVNEDLWKRVRESGFKFLFLTTDTQLLGKRESDMRNGFQLPNHLKMANMVKYMDKEETEVKSSKDSGLAEFVKLHKNNEIDWTIIPYIKKVSGLKVFAKGIMCYEDAKLAIANGADGIHVSNHGARQLDTTPATIDVLAEVVRAVKEMNTPIPIFFDGGVRKGSDVLKALAIGADVVFIGRAVLWGLATNGQIGVERVIDILNRELKDAMLATGCMNVEQARGNKSLIYEKPEYIFKL